MTRLLGVIGHVDHGKTALTRALTGTDTDRLAEEKRRGISIALGFAHTDIGGVAVDFIDMPGHERFVRTMISGATGIDAALLVVAANEGIKPQTREHIDIAGLLGLRRVIIAVSKADLVDASQAALVGREAAALAARAGLSGPSPVPTSAATGGGIVELRQAITEALADPVAREDAGFPYLPIDRAFSVPGHGTVVTGTLRRGGLAAGDSVVLVPGAEKLRVRGLQVHGARVTTARPGQRVAVNLRDVEARAIARGAALVAPDQLRPTNWLTVSLRTVPEAPPLRSGTRLRLLFGTAELDARLRLLDREVMGPGETGPAQLHCAEPVAVPTREPFILRAASPASTLAGGHVLDTDVPRQRRHAPKVLARMSVLQAGKVAGILAQELKLAAAFGVPLDRLGRLAGLAPANTVAVLQDLPVLLGRGRVAVLREALAWVLQRVPLALAAHQSGLARPALAARLGAVSPEVLEEAVGRLLAAGTVQQAGGLLRVPRPQEDQARATAEAALASRLAEAIRQGGWSPPDATAIAADPPARRLLDRLVREGILVRAPDRVQKRDVLFHRDAIEAAKRQLAPLLRSEGLLVKDIGAALGTTRKFSVPLLEHLDAIGFTKRNGDRRILRSDAKEPMGLP